MQTILEYFFAKKNLQMKRVHLTTKIMYGSNRNGYNLAMIN